MARQSSVTAPRRGARFNARPLFAALAAAGVIAPAHAATIAVTTGGDAGNGSTCTLRQAAESLNAGVLQGLCANSGGGFGTNDTVDLTLQSGTITLAGGLPIVSTLTTMTFDGPGAGTLTISGAGASRVFEGPGLVIDQLTVANGRSVGPGGCIYAGEMLLADSVVTGCTATSDPGNPYYNGVGGGVAAKYLNSNRSSILNNTAHTAGGGAFVYAGQFTQTLVSGNTVNATACIDPPSPDVCAPAMLGGGGILGETVLTLGSTISGNTVNASTMTKYDLETQGDISFRLGLGGGISQFPLSLAEPEGAAGLKSMRARLAFPSVPGTSGKSAGPARGAFKAKVAGARARTKADGVGLYMVGLSHTTVSGNRVRGSSAGTIEEGKYSGGGVASLNPFYNAEVVNSTISGNRVEALKANGFAFGGAMIAGSADLSNSTITGNVGETAVVLQAIYYGPGARAAKSGRTGIAAKAGAGVRQFLAKAKSQSKRGANKQITEPVFESTILSNPVGDGYDVLCTVPCTITGSNNLIRSWASTTTVPPDTLTSDPELAPLAYNGGVTAGAPGHPATLSMPTHLLFSGSPAIDTGNNVEEWEVDQRGRGFPRVVGAGPDIGAIEGVTQRPNVPVPALAPWLVALMSALLGVLGLRSGRRRAS